MRVVVDAMGSDAHPVPDITGAVTAAQETDVEILLVGSESLIRQQLGKLSPPSGRIEIINADESVTMTDSPSHAARNKPSSSMHIGMNLVRDGEADAFVTAGNTGAAYAIAMLHTLKRIPGVKRPALSAIFPINRQPVIFLDIGANAESRSDWLVQFALMGNIYAQKALGLPNPRVGLLSNGEEDVKGNQTILDASRLLQQTTLRFVGHIEPKDIMSSSADVVVADGFTGNILLKTFEASTRYLGSVIRDEINAGLLTKLGGLLARPAFTRARQRIDTREVGGAPLLGVKGVVIISHGSADALAIRNAVLQAKRAAEGRIIEAIEENIAHLPQS